jgi:hypothetical protein
MPIYVKPRKKGIQHRPGRGGHFDRQVMALAPEINTLQLAGLRDIRKLAQRLNAAGFRAPSGKPFAYSTMRRFLRRKKELQLGEGPRTVSAAASRRPPRPYKFRPTQGANFSKAARQETRRIMSSDMSPIVPGSQTETTNGN